VAAERAAAVRYKSRIARTVTAWVVDRQHDAVAAMLGLGLPRHHTTTATRRQARATAAATAAAAAGGGGTGIPSDPADLLNAPGSDTSGDLTFLRCALAAPLLELRALDAVRTQFPPAAPATHGARYDAGDAGAGAEAAWVGLVGEHLEALGQLLHAVRRAVGPAQWEALRLIGTWPPTPPPPAAADFEPYLLSRAGGDGSGAARGDPSSSTGVGTDEGDWHAGQELQHLHGTTTMEEEERARGGRWWTWAAGRGWLGARFFRLSDRRLRASRF
jgi:hypothetical protein